MSCKLILVYQALLLFCFCNNIYAEEPGLQHKEFKHFSVDLPDRWDGDEQTGFISDNPEEYLLTLTRKDDAGERIAAQVSIYLLPNKPGVDVQTAARTLAQAQENTSEPEKKDNLWVFTGEPRTRAMKGRATTMVNADPAWLFIIIAQDPDNLGSEQIVQSLKGKTETGRLVLGR